MLLIPSALVLNLVSFSLYSCGTERSIPQANHKNHDKASETSDHTRGRIKIGATEKLCCGLSCLVELDAKGRRDATDLGKEKTKTSNQISLPVK